MSRRCCRWLTFVAVLATGSCFGSVAFGQEVQWRYDYNVARQEAHTRKRPILIDFGTESCFWCKRLDASTFRDAAVVKLLNERFIPLKIDAQRDAPLADALRIQSYPTLVFASSDGRIMATQEGYVEAGRLLDALQRLVETVNAAPAPVADNSAGSRTVTAEPVAAPRAIRAGELLTLAREDYRTRQFLCCLDRCETLSTQYADLPEATEAQRLAAEITTNPEKLRAACDHLRDRLAGLYLELAESWLKNGQPQLAVLYLERVVQTFPGSRQAEAAQLRLSQVQGQPEGAVRFKK
jgi:thioredoxin-related protein